MANVGFNELFGNIWVCLEKFMLSGVEVAHAIKPRLPKHFPVEALSLCVYTLSEPRGNLEVLGYPSTPHLHASKEMCLRWRTGMGSPFLVRAS